MASRVKNIKNLHKEPLLNFLIIAILVFFVANRFFSHQPGTAEQYASRIMQPILSMQSSWVSYWKEKKRQRMSVAQALQQLDNVQQELAWTQSALANAHAALHYETITHDVITNLDDIADDQKIVNNLNRAHSELIEESKRESDLNRNFKQIDNSSNNLLAPVILRNISPDAHFLIIEGGKDQGLEVDMVCVYQNNLIGRITEVYEHLSKVLLVTDRSCKVSAICTQHQVYGIYEGNNTTDNGKLCHISHLFEVQPDDVVITSGEGLLFPRGFILGRITQAERVGVNYEISVKPLIDMRAITAVAILSAKASGMSS